EAHDVDGGKVRREHPGLVPKVPINHNFAVLSAEGLYVGKVQAMKADGRQCPNERLSGTAKIDFVVEFPCGLFGRETIFKLEPPNASLDSLSFKYWSFPFFFRHHDSFASNASLFNVYCRAIQHLEILSVNSNSILYNSDIGRRNKEFSDFWL